MATESGPPPLKDVDPPVGVPWEAWLDLTSLGSMQMVITQNTLMGELCHYETRVISQTSLPLTPTDYPDQPGTHWELEGPWASNLLLNPMKNLKSSKYPLIKPNRAWSQPICVIEILDLTTLPECEFALRAKESLHCEVSLKSIHNLKTVIVYSAT